MDFFHDSVDVNVQKFVISSRSGFFTLVDLILLVQSTFLFLFFPSTFFYGSLILIAFRIFRRRAQIKEESLTVFRELGVQLCCKTFGGSESHTFIEKSQIDAIIINEAVRFHSIVYCMAFIVKGQNTLTLAFQNTMPKLKELLPIFRKSRALILGEITDDERD
eukprot:TRINITY_DN10343_c0_g1_i1.p1 TRINITY_DN10343_c0_g1~~TRINITY_DN10343_c0_g1_i1.p1  ORF type:complete len:163 (+),score=16.66 TRINITY_DN10343_c0_g1_i1:45-533(+)